MQEGDSMKKKSISGTATLLLALVVVAGCSRQDAATAAAPAAPAAPIPAPAPEVCNSCGVVRSVTAVSQEGRASGAGAVIGGIVGGVAGNQVGGGSGKKIATAAGVIGGALLGNNIEQNRNATSQYEVVIDMETGGQQIILVPNSMGISPGSQVTVNGGNITLR
jgi:outer membrane lipoprotein SlyB